MGLTNVEIVIKKSYESKASRTIDFLIDSGAVYSVVNKEILKELKIKPHRKRSFFLANGEKIEREVGDAYFEYKSVGGAAPVIFGESGDNNLLGATTLESLELVLDPYRRELRPLSMSLMKMNPDKGYF